MNQQRRLTDEQERMRVKGLRALARMIARHHLEHSSVCANGVTGQEDLPPGKGRLMAGGEPEREDGAG